MGVGKHVMIDRNTRCMAYTVLSTAEGGPRAAGGGKLVAAPWTVYSPTSDVSALTVTVDRDRIFNAPVFDYARVDEYSTPAYINNVYGYYGVSPGAGIGTATSTTTTGATTGAAATSGAARTGATASPGAAASAPATASPGAMRSPATAASPGGRASPSSR